MFGAKDPLFCLAPLILVLDVFLVCGPVMSGVTGINFNTPSLVRTSQLSKASVVVVNKKYVSTEIRPKTKYLFSLQLC